MSLDEIRALYYEQIKSVTYFLDPKDGNYNIIKECVFKLCNIIGKLIREKVLTISKLDLIFDEFNFVFDSIAILNNNKIVEIYSYIFLLIKELINLCEKEEYFEACKNLNEFYKKNLIE